MLAFTWDDENVAHLEEYHPEVSPDDVDSIWELPTVRMANTRGRSGALFLGIDRHGRLLAVPADPTGQEGVWRPRTAHVAESEWQRKAYYGIADEQPIGEES